MNEHEEQIISPAGASFDIPIGEQTIKPDGIEPSGEATELEEPLSEELIAALRQMERQDARKYKKLQDKAHRQKRLRTKASRKRNRRG